MKVIAVIGPFSAFQDFLAMKLTEAFSGTQDIAYDVSRHALTFGDRQYVYISDPESVRGHHLEDVLMVRDSTKWTEGHLRAEEVAVSRIRH